MPTHVCAFLRHGGQLLTRRRRVDEETSDWDVPSGPCDEDDPAEAAREILNDRIGVAPGIDHVRTGKPVEVGDITYHPVLFDLDVPDASVPVVEASDSILWASPTVFLLHGRTPGLWACYERVAPSVRSITADTDHGAAYLSIRALEVLRDRAAVQLAEDDEDAEELKDLGLRLLQARPSMSVLHNRVNRVLSELDGTDGTVARRIHDASIDGIERAINADAEAAENAAQYIGGTTVLTISRSGTVFTAIQTRAPSRLYVAESRPGGEGIELAEDVAERMDTVAVLHTDAAIGHVLDTEDIDVVLVGADAITADGDVVNKTGTRLAALAADHAGVPVYAVAASDKITETSAVNLETGNAEAVYDGDADIDVRNPTFDVTPAELVEGVITERGPLTNEGVSKIADEHADAAQWTV